MTLRLIFRTQQ